MTVDMPGLVSTGMKEFVGRTWLLPHILKWLEPTEDRALIITGKPGTGKSSLIAWLAGLGQAPDSGEEKLQLERVRSYVKAVHFCMSKTLNSVPQALARSLAEQLVRKVTGFSEALVASLGDLVRVDISQTVNKADSVTGIHIERLDLGQISEVSSFNRVIREPLRRLYNRWHDEPTLILIDALDEAQELDKPTGVIHLLSSLDLPEQVRFLMTTRPDPRVLKRFTDAKHIDLFSDAPPAVDDVRSFAYERLTFTDNQRRAQSADSISRAAEGNFLYARLVIEDLLLGVRDMTDLTTMSLPKGLSGIYSEFMNRDLGADESLWFGTYEPMLGLIAVARGNGIGRGRLESIMGKDLNAGLRKCHQYLSGSLPDGPFRPFHKSFADYLLEDPENKHYRIDAASIHRRLIDAYLAGATSWDDVDWAGVDDYGLLYLASHLYALRKDKTYRSKLYGLLCSPFMWEKHRRYGSHQSFAADISLAIEAARSETPRNLVEEIRGYFIYARLGSISTVVQPEVLGVLAAVGEIEKAKGYAALTQDREKQCKAYCLISKALISRHQYEEARTLLRDTLAAADKIDVSISYSNHLNALREVVQLLTAAEDKEGLERIAASAEEKYHPTERAQVFGCLAAAFARAGEHKRAVEMARRARAALEQIDAAGLTGQLGNVALDLAEMDDRIGVELILSKASVAEVEYVSNELKCKVVQALSALGLKKEAEAFANEIFEAALSVVPLKQRVWELSDAAKSFMQANEKEKATEAAESALDSALAVTNSFDRASLLSKLAKDISDIDEARLAGRLTDEILKIALNGAQSPESMILTFAVEGLTNLGAKAELQRLLESMPGLNGDDLALDKLACGLAQLGELDLALEVSDQVKERVYKSGALSSITKELTREGSYERAFEVVERISYEPYKMEVLSWICINLAESGQESLATRAADQALIEVRKALKSYTIRGAVLGEIAQALVKVGYGARALTVANRAFEDLEPSQTDSVTCLDLGPAIKALIQVREFGKAFRLSKKSFDTELHRQMAQAFAEIGELEMARSKAAQLLDWATYDSKQPSLLDSPIDELCAASRTLAAVGESQRPRSLALQALELARKRGTREYGKSGKSRVLGKAARALSEAGEKELAIIAARESLEAAKEGLKEYLVPLPAASAMADAVEALVSAGDRQTATEAASELLQAAEDSLDLSFIWEAGRASAFVGNVKGLERVRALAASLKDVSREAEMIQLALDFSKVGEMEQALDCILQALESVQTTTAGYMWSVLGSGAEAFAAIDGGETLWCIFEAVMEVDRWW